MRILLQNQAAAFQQVARRTKSLRSSNREISQLVPESIFSGSESQSQTSEDRLSSTIGSAEFSFDDTIVNSTVYRKALAAILQRSRQKRRKMGFKNENLRDQKPQVDILTVIRCDTCGDLLSHRIKGLNGVNERVLQTECRHLHHELCLFNQLLVMGPSRMCCPTCARPSGVNLTFMNDSHFARRRQDDLRTRQTTAA